MSVRVAPRRRHDPGRRAEVTQSQENSGVRTPADPPPAQGVGRPADPAVAGHEGGDGSAPRRRRPVRTSLVALAVVVVAAASGLAATGALGSDGGGSAAAAPSGPARTAKVEKATLTRTETVDGTLGYGEATAVRAPGSGTPAEDGGQGGAPAGRATAGDGSGVLTQLPGEGQVIRRGDPVYSVDERRVPLLYGSTPLYRTLDVGAEGGDVQVLERNLAALGHTGFTVDREYTSGTAEAVRAWQEDLGREETGTVAPGDAVVAPGARRVAEVKASIATVPSGDVLTWTGTTRLVSVDLDVRYEDLVDEGTEATVALPDGTRVNAVVADVGNAATARPAQEDGGSDGATLPVELTVRDQEQLGRYQAAPVDVTLAAETRRDVLAVPVNALVARQGGGYAVQVVTDGGVEYRPVRLGMFADGRVEVSGAGVTEGLDVGVPG